MKTSSDMISRAPSATKRSKKKKNSMKGISRIDSKGTRGWYVRVYKNGKTYSKLYSDSKYNGKERALKFAQKAREMAMETINKIPDKPIRRMVTKDKRNKSGVVGVSKTSKKTKTGKIVDYYQVTWSPRPGKIKNRQWSVRKYGDNEAFEMAKSFREEVMQKIYGERYVSLKKEEQAAQNPDNVYSLAENSIIEEADANTGT